LTDVTTAEWTIQAPEHRQEDGTPTEILCQRDSALSLGSREGKTWCPIAWSRYRAWRARHRYLATLD